MASSGLSCGLVMLGAGDSRPEVNTNVACAPAPDSAPVFQGSDTPNPKPRAHSQGTEPETNVDPAPCPPGMSPKPEAL